MKRQRGRGRPGGPQGGNGGGKPQQNANRAFESNGPDGVKIRGHAQHVFEKYQQLARDASSSGDRVLAENYLQHAEHYFRVLRAVQPHRTAAEILGRDSIASGFDIDFEDENGEELAESQEGSDVVAASEPRQDQRQEQRQEQRYEPRQDQNRNDQQRQDQPRRDRDRPYGRDRNDRQQDRQPDQRQPDIGGEGERPQAERVQGDRPQERQQGERPERRERPQRPYREDRRERFEPRDQDEPRSDPLAVVEPQSTPLTQAVVEAVSSPMLRSEDGSTSHAPAFLQARTEVTEEAAPAKVRRRRVPRASETADPATLSPTPEDA